jgi:hypothetical protein
MRLPWLSSHRLWYAGFLAWAVALYVLSSMPKVLPEGGPEIPNLDKIVHFGYFMGGAFILATGILLRKGVGTHPLLRIFLPALLFAAIGMLDEFHQTAPATTPSIGSPTSSARSPASSSQTDFIRSF